MTKLLIVFCRGAMDGLNVVVPAGDARYHDARPTLAHTDATLLPLDTTFGLHPSAPRLAERFAAGSVAIIPAAGFEGQSRSHFAAQALLEQAQPTGGSGWIGRHLAATAGTTAQPFRAVSVGQAGVPPTLRGSADVLATTDISTVRLGLLRPKGHGARLKGYAVLDSPLTPSATALGAAWPDPADAAGAGAHAALGVLERVVSRTSTTPPNQVPSAETTFGADATGTSFGAASAVLDAELGTEIVMVNLGGWDTHDNQGSGAEGALADLVGDLDAALSTFLDRHAGTGDGLCAVVMTEFGRRVAENSSGGTDHGRGSVAFVIGDRVAGGVKGQWPGLIDLDDGDVRAVNDLRAVQAELAATVLGTPDVAAVVPGAGNPLGVVA